ncbi:unnamed protein product [Arabidopsis thaliana]|uniref:(thale cress) hypothetical protein n=1 Tax=Arabidopsis thaliana TaxID=3702 RepID=A0A7G2EBL6_ARATH|nr:unnamed protein product [Arabidopsis thaliana]
MARVRDGTGGHVYESTERPSEEVSTSQTVSSEIEIDGDAAVEVPTEPAETDVSANKTPKKTAEIEEAIEESLDGDEASSKGTADIEKGKT